MIYFAANLPRFSVLTQGTVRRAIPIRGEQPTLDAVRRSVKTASAEVVNMHLQWYHELVRTRKAHKAVLMWKHRTLSKAWGAWYEKHIQIVMEKEGNAEVERMTRQLKIRPKDANTKQPRMQSSQTQQRFLDDALNANREWIKNTRPGHVLSLLRAVAAEFLLQHAAELKVARDGAAQERERQRLIEEARLLEERRWEAWRGA